MGSKRGQGHDGGLMGRLLAWLVERVSRHPWLVLVATLLSCVACLLYAGSYLTFQTHRNDLIGKNKDYYLRWQQYIAEFGDDDDMVVVVQGHNRARMEAALEQTAERIRRQPERFDRLFYKVDLAALNNRALLFLPADQIRHIQDNLKPMALLLEPPVLGGLDPLFGWKSLTLVHLLHEGERRAQSLAADHTTRPESDPALKQLDAYLAAASAALGDPNKYRSPWLGLMPASASAPERLDQTRYFFSADEGLAFLLVRPQRDPANANFTLAQGSIAALRRILDDLRPSFPDLELGLTGLPVLETDEMLASQNDSQWASWWALLGVALLYLIVYRSWRYPLMTVATLVIGSIWAVGWLTLTVGHLNILSSAFAVMLIGMGDYGVLWVARFGQERAAGVDRRLALQATARHVGPSILTAALTTALAFFAAMLADLQAVAELGWIAGCGVLFCALACFLVMPALLTLLDRGDAAASVPNRPSLSASEGPTSEGPTILPYPAAFLPSLLSRPRWVLGGGLAVLLVLGWCALGLRYDHNLLHLQNPNQDSVRWEHTLIDRTAGASWHALSYTTTPEEALALKARFEQSPMVSRVAEVASLVPRDQDRKIEQLADIQERLRRLPPRGRRIDQAIPPLTDIERSGQRLLDHLDKLSATTAEGVAWSLKKRWQEFSILLTKLGPDVAAQRLLAFQQRACQDLIDDLHRLRDISTPAPIELAEVPACLRERFIGKNGQWLLRVFCKDCLWEYDALAGFVAQIHAVDPDATGKPMTTLEGLRAMRNGFALAAVYALLAMLLVLLVDFGKLRHTLLALLPLVAGLIATLGLMALLGIPLNPANMIAFPLILGVGADNGVHVVHDYLGRPRTQRYRLGRATGLGILVAALTTVLGFGTLALASHRGLASLGAALALGVTCCMLAALILLPAFLSLGKLRKKAAPTPTLPLTNRAA